MPRVKIARKSTAIDMTAMCDVAFLLLTFFILTATARQPEPLPVDTPSSVVTVKQPESDIATITFGDGKVFFKVAGQPIRRNLLAKMGKEYGIQFTPEEQYKFSLVETFGVSIRNMKEFLALSPADRNEIDQKGISADSTGERASELHDWIFQARTATAEVDQKFMVVSLKGDAQEEYPVVKKIVNILQEQNLNKFNLITDLEVQPK